MILPDGAVVRLRSPIEDDAEALLAYLDAVRRETDCLMFDPADDLPSERAWIRGALEDPLALKIAAEADGAIVGLCEVRADGGLRRQRHRAEIGISIRAAWCNRGLGTLLMRELIDWSRRQDGLTVLRLGVFAHNERAIAVYHKLGFVEEGIRRRAVRYTDGTYVDERMMSLWPEGEAEPRR